MAANLSITHIPNDGPQSAGKKGRRKHALSQRARSVSHNCSILPPKKDPWNPGFPHEAGCIFLYSWLRFGSSEIPALTRCYGNEGRSAGTLQRASCAMIPPTYNKITRQGSKINMFPLLGDHELPELPAVRGEFPFND